MLALGVVAGPADQASAADEEPSLTELRARRRTLVRDIARATDELARLEATAEDLLARVARQAVDVESSRRSVASRLVHTWVAAADADPMAALRGQSWSHAITAPDRRALVELELAHDDLAAQRVSALDATEATRAAHAELVALREELESTISARENADAEAARARAAATASARGGGRTVRSTAEQSALMGRFPFGPVTDIPAGLVPTGAVLEGKASWYGPGFDGRLTASGAVFDQQGWTVAHRTLPLGTILLVRRGEVQVLVLVNDRGPFVGGRILDLSKGVAEALGTIRAGVAPVSAQVLVEG